jgi:hypothetical protein
MATQDLQPLKKHCTLPLLKSPIASFDKRKTSGSCAESNFGHVRDCQHSCDGDTPEIERVSHNYNHYSIDSIMLTTRSTKHLLCSRFSSISSLQPITPTSPRTSQQTVLNSLSLTLAISGLLLVSLRTKISQDNSILT